MKRPFPPPRRRTPEPQPPEKPTLATRLRTSGEALFGGGLISGMVAVVAGVSAIYSQYQATQSQIQATVAQEAATAAETELKRATLELNRDRGDREDQLVVYNRIEGQLKEASPSALAISASYVTLVRDPQIRAALCETISSVAVNASLRQNPANRAEYDNTMIHVRHLMRDCASEAWLQQTLAPETGFASGSAPSTDQVVDRQAPVSRVLSATTASLDGWDVDVFWCQARPGGQSRAQRIAAGLAKKSDTRTRVGNELLGRVRLRSLTGPAAEKLGADGNFVSGSEDEQGFADAIAREANTLSGAPPAFRYSRTSSQTRWYVSLFVCAPS